ncbi:MAG: hypothetical protein AB7D37_12590 [Desulfovibrio sp.]
MAVAIMRARKHVRLLGVSFPWRCPEKRKVFYITPPLPDAVKLDLLRWFTFINSGFKNCQTGGERVNGPLPRKQKNKDTVVQEDQNSSPAEGFGLQGQPEGRYLARREAGDDKITGGRKETELATTATEVVAKNWTAC